MQQIADWLEKLGMSDYAQRFAESDIDKMSEFDKGLGRRKDGPAHPDYLDEATCRIP